MSFHIMKKIIKDLKSSLQKSGPGTIIRNWESHMLPLCWLYRGAVLFIVSFPVFNDSPSLLLLHVVLVITRSSQFIVSLKTNALALGLWVKHVLAPKCCEGFLEITWGQITLSWCKAGRCLSEFLPSFHQWINWGTRRSCTMLNSELVAEPKLQLPSPGLFRVVLGFARAAHHAPCRHRSVFWWPVPQLLQWDLHSSQHSVLQRKGVGLWSLWVQILALLLSNRVT